MDDPVLAVLSRLVPGGVRPGELRRDDHVLRWAESGSGDPAVVLDAALGEPGTLAWAGVMPLLAPRTRVLLGQLAALRHPELVAGLVLVDPADEEFLAGLPAEDRRQEIASGEVIVEQYASGKLPDTVREIFGSFAQRLTGDRQLRALILDAYVSCYAKRSQARTVLDEKQLVFRITVGHPSGPGGCGPARRACRDIQRDHQKIPRRAAGMD